MRGVQEEVTNDPVFHHFLINLKPSPIYEFNSLPWKMYERNLISLSESLMGLVEGNKGHTRETVSVCHAYVSKRCLL